MIDEKVLIERLEESEERYDDVSFAQLNEFGHNLDYEYAKGKRDGMAEAIEIVKDLASEHNNDFCEWKFVKSVADGGYFYSSGCNHKRFSDLHSFEFCPYCRKKINVVPAPYKKGE